MPIPNTPVTREEVYLDAIATGDASGIPAYPVTREEMYLDAIAKNGGGGGGGSGGGVLVCHMSTVGEDEVLDKTWQEISDAGFAVLYVDESQEGVTELTILQLYTIGKLNDDTMFGVGFYNATRMMDIQFVATSSTGTLVRQHSS